ncbi:PREDICTED: F-box only protein 41-like [Rhinopithecus bieti]|uniref:F-box only protein 41-like n=1 Tax=Rhinopithecus bieti TaxID=61621 RepID=UPI00083C546F|nr:PREDICTED: F-box only protein 41-like [Rhinopithecus bieti]
MASLDLPYRCPRCGEHKRFRSLSSLRAHLEYSHTYETLYILSKTNSICDGAAAAAAAAAAASGFPLAPEPAALLAVPGARREVFESTSFQGKEQLLEVGANYQYASAFECIPLWGDVT